MSGEHSRQPKVWLHIGMPKTGTTTLQSVLYANRGLLEQHGYFYPDLGVRQHFPLVNKLAGAKVLVPDTEDWGRHARFTGLLDRHSMQAHTSIISSENFFLRPVATSGRREEQREQAFGRQRKLVERTAEYLSGCDVTVLVWLRRQDSWLMSWYKEVVKTSLCTEDFSEFAQRTIGTDLYRLVRLWVDAFGRSRVVCRSYDALAARRTSSVDDFLQTVCPDLPAASLVKSGASENLSFSNEALWLKRRVNAALKREGIEPGKTLKNEVVKLLDDVSRSSAEPNRPLLTPAQRQDLMQRYLSDNRRLVDELGYEDLRPLADTSDLDVPLDPSVARAAGALGMARHCVDRMINAYILGK